MNHKEQLGFVTVAQNTETVDYLQLAYNQAVNIKTTQKYNRYAVIVDKETRAQITNEHKKVFDYIIELPTDDAKHYKIKMANEWQVFYLTPFKETIKLESDLLFTRSIDHWIHAFRLQNIVFSYHCRDYQSHIIEKSPYRKLFRDNNLPDIYTGLYYFRFTQESTMFFRIAKTLFQNWDKLSKELANYSEDIASTDVVFALAARILGEDKCIIPTVNFINFVHMKSAIQGWSDTQQWMEYCNVEHDKNILRINNVNQYHPIHFYEKNFKP